jgi:hypothetical protein
MARARNIKPSFFTNELLGVADPMVSLTFVGLWCLADKVGVLEDRPLRIKAELFPYRDGLDINGYLTELARLGFIVRYVNEQRRFIQVLNFRKHQSPHNTEKGKGYPFHTDPKSLILNHNGEGTVSQPLSNGVVTQAERPDSLIPDSLIPDSGFTDSLIPDTGFTDSRPTSPDVPAPPSPGRSDVAEVDKPDPCLEQDYEAAHWIFDQIRKLNPGHKQPNFKGWANDIRLMRERDKRSHREICELFAWANRDDFWRTNILSPSKLRAQWDRLTLAKNTKGTKAPTAKFNPLDARNHPGGEQAHGHFSNAFGGAVIIDTPGSCQTIEGFATLVDESQ